VKIGEASAASGISQRMIRHYEKIGLMSKAARRDSGYRDYDERDFHTLRFIGLARDLGFSVEEIGKLLELWLARAGELKRKEEALHEMRRSLEELAERCTGDDCPDCPIIGELEGRPAASSRRSTAKQGAGNA